uniref:CNL1 n=1 Tax=Triticum turgidum subsp. durum TaxID=4567 RepID=A0A291B5C4_TRITD|nr:CNL1 [Triticum turgidum subsp. durum]
MEAALVSAATGVLKPVVEKLATLVGSEYKRFKGVRGEIKSLTRELAAMDAFLLKMSEQEDLDEQDKVWMNEVRELSYEMEDFIDNFMKGVGDKDTKPDGCVEMIKNLLGKLGKMKTRRRIGKEIQDLKKQIVEVGDRNARYKTGVAISNTKNATIDPRALAIFEHASKLVGIDQPKSEIIKLLTEEDGCATKQQQLKMLSIVGSGGMGKTTLANQVYQEMKGEFKCHVFISVSRNPDMVNILRTILSEVAKKDYAHTEARDEQQLLSKISNFLIDKSYFIVVDDIWKTKTWDVIKCAFPMTSCGILITTTRLKDVASSCCSSGGHIYNISPLDIDHSRQLFHGRLFQSLEDCPSYLEDVSEQILKKCDGLPLAIIAISGLLANKGKTKNIWNQVKDSIGRALERNPSVEAMIKILSLSYFDLPPHLKTCLLYLSIFPEDSIIERKDLIRRWIAEGFIRKEGTYTVHDLGEMYFNELVNRSLIQPVETSSRYYRVENCRVHDIILDFIISKSMEQNFVTLLGVPNLSIRTQSKACRLALHAGEHGNSSTPTGMVLSHIRSLNVFGNSVEIPSLDEFMHLRVLDFGGCTQLENHHLVNIGRLFQLRYLNLRRTRISELPEQISYARCLQMLDLRQSYVRELPASIVNLRNLLHLLVDNDVKFPGEIKKMQLLETLKGVDVLNQPIKFLQELGQLKNLRKLHLDFEHDSANGDTARVKDCTKAIASSLCKLGTHNLRSLTILDGHSFLQAPPCPAPLSLQKLMTWQSAIPQVPNWVSSLVNLQHLRLEVKGVGQEDLHILGGLPSLLVLDLEGTAPSKHRLKVSGAVGFRWLKFFYYDANFHSIDLTFEAGSMPKLENLEIQGTLEIGSLDLGIENLPCLVTVKCKIVGNAGTFVAAMDTMEIAASAHPNHPILLIGRP